MVSISERYPRTGFLKAADVKEADLILQIDYLELDRDFGASKAAKDVLIFSNDQRELVLNGATSHQIAKLHGDDSENWPGRWIALYLDPDVLNPSTGEKTGGIRVRDQVPAHGNGNEAPNDEVPF